MKSPRSNPKVSFITNFPYIFLDSITRNNIEKWRYFRHAPMGLTNISFAEFDQLNCLLLITLKHRPVKIGIYKSEHHN